MRALLIFLKLPVSGKVKTRLGKSIGPEAASEAYKFLVSKVFDQIKDAPLDAIRILYDPPCEEAAIRTWLAPSIEVISARSKISFHPQAEGDLGYRLEKGFGEAFAEGCTRVAAIGTDCIEVGPRHFAETWGALDGQAEVVFGPAHDGGYYLVALSAPRVEIFQNIPWSEPDTLERSVAAAEEANLRVVRLEALSDIDEVEDWERIAPK